MKTRIAFIVALAIAGSAHTASAQGRRQQQIVLSPSVLKSMVTQKPKSKGLLAARHGMMRRTPAAATVAPSPSVAPTSVRAIPRKSGK